MSDTREPLPPELDAFLAPERRRPDPPAGIEDEIFARIGATLGWPGGGPGPNGGPDGSGSPGGPAPDGAVVAGGAKGATLGSVSKTLATLLVGGVLGAAVHEAYDRAHDRRPPAPARAEVAVARPPAPPPPPPAPSPLPPPEPPRALEPRAVTAPPRPEPAGRGELRERDRGLGAERALIEQARTALARQNHAAALAALERHARDFPRGELEEERESLEVQALVGLERHEHARKVAARFHRRFPHSIFAAVVDEALMSIP